MKFGMYESGNSIVEYRFAIECSEEKMCLEFFISQTKSSCKLMCAQIDIHVHTKTFLFLLPHIL